MEFEQRCADTHAQSCHEQIQQSSRCRLYKELKENHDIEPYLRRNISYTLRITFTKMRLSSHKLLVERGRWVKPKINYCDRLCTLCHKHDIQDEYHALMICSRYESLRKKYLKPYYYKRPSVYKFIQLMNTVNKREQFRLMIFTKLLMKDFNCTLWYTILNTCTSLHYNFNIFIFYTPLFSLTLNENLILLNLS